MSVIIILFITVAGFLICFGAYSTRNKYEYNDTPGMIDETMEYINVYGAFKSKHSSFDSGILITWIPCERGYMLRKRIEIFEIDGESAAQAVDALRERIKRVWDDPDNKYKGDVVEQSSVVNRIIADFWGTDKLLVDFWEITDDKFEYMEDRYIEFDSAFDLVAKNKSLKETLRKIENETKARYPNAKFVRDKDALKIKM